MDEKEESRKIEFIKEKILLVDNLPLNIKHLLRAISWAEYVPVGEFNSDDQAAQENLIKLINYLTRKA